MFDDFIVEVNGVNEYTFETIANFNIGVFEKKCPKNLQIKVINSLFKNTKDKSKAV